MEKSQLRCAEDRDAFKDLAASMGLLWMIQETGVSMTSLVDAILKALPVPVHSQVLQHRPLEDREAGQLVAAIITGLVKTLGTDRPGARAWGWRLVLDEDA